MQLLPQPQSCKRGQGTWSLPPATAVCIDPEVNKHLCIRHKLKTLGIAVAVSEAAEQWSIRIGDCRQQLPSLPKHDEAYVLVCDRYGLHMQAVDKDGLFWALVTLEQLLDAARTMPCVTIRDYPTFGLRYHHDDISRKQVSKVKDFKRIIRNLSRFKIKYYTPYMEDMLFLRSNPDIGKGRGRLKPDEVKAIHKEAKKYNVTIFPTFSLIGHQENLLQHPKYRKYAMEVFQEPSSYDPRKNILRPYLKKVIRDVCDLFPDAPYFHACFDETQGLATDVIIEHANWCARQISKRGKRMMMWIDMFKNHDAIDRLQELDPDIMLVEWNYGKHGQETDSYHKAGVTYAGLAGYNCTCCFIPDFRNGRQNMVSWTRVMKRCAGPGFGSSIWGDHGYENHRDLCWNQYAYFGECSWRGKTPGKDFEKRFQSIFYGAVNKPLLKLIDEELTQRRISPQDLWRLFRAPMTGLRRRLHHESKLAGQAADQLQLTERCLRLCTQARKACRRETEHIDHYEVGLLRERLVLRRLQLAQSLNDGAARGRIHTMCTRVIAELQDCRQRYHAAWLRHNKKSGLEVSLAVYDFLLKDLQSLLQPPLTNSQRYVPVDLEQHWNSCMSQVYGVPLGLQTIDQVPFHCPPLSHTHCAIKPGKRLSLPLDNPGRLKDLHLLYGGQTSHDDSPAACLRVSLYSGRTSVFKEQLLSIKDICCWWAPRGDHMWAGGGLKYTDPKRNTYAWDCRNFHGLMHLQHFKLPADCTADRLVLSANGSETIALFALTLELTQD